MILLGGRTLVKNRNKVNFSILDIYEIDKRLIISWGTSFDACYNSIIKNSFHPMGLVNCLNYGHPADSMGAFKEFVEDLTKKCRENKVPIVGGNVIYTMQQTMFQ